MTDACGAAYPGAGSARFPLDTMSMSASGSGLWSCWATSQGAIHLKAMPVMLTTPDEIDTWLQAPWEIARELQRPLPDNDMLIVSKGNRKDPA